MSASIEPSTNNIDVTADNITFDTTTDTTDVLPLPTTTDAIPQTTAIDVIKKQLSSPINNTRLSERYYINRDYKLSTSSTDAVNYIIPVQFYNLFYTDLQYLVSHGLIWFFARDSIFWVSDYSYQDLLTMEAKYPSFIHYWCHYAIEERLMSKSCDSFTLLIRKNCRNMSPVNYTDTIASLLMNRLIKILTGSRRKYALDVLTAAGRVLRNMFVSDRLTFSKVNNLRSYDFGEFLHNSGLLNIINHINTEMNIKLESRTCTSNGEFYNKPTMIHLLNTNGFRHLTKPLTIVDKNARDLCAIVDLDNVYPDSMAVNDAD